jgi:C4-dicarboxylate-specific signal transduction histidine kinase
MITSTSEADPSAIRLSRRLRTLYRCQREFFRAPNELQLLQAVCQFLVAGDDLCLAWIGYSEDDAEKTLRPVAKAGRSLDFLDQVKISWGESESPQDPAGIAVRTSHPCRINNIEADPRDSSWRSAAIAQGFHSCIAVPLIAQDRHLGAVNLRGALGLYTAEPDAFDDNAIEHYAELAMCLTHAVAMLRGDLAGDLAYDVAALRAAEERRRSEDALRLARVELARIMQMTAASQVAASIAHEVNQPLVAIVASGNAAMRWLASAPPDLDKARAALKRVVDSGHHASDVIGGIKSMFKKDGQVKATLDVNQLIHEVFELLEGEIRSQQVSIRSELGEELPPVLANRVQLQQVLVNLIINAIEAMSTAENRVRSLRVKTEMQESDYLLIMVEDSGTGIDAENIDRIFDAFYTTKAHGTGMGLSICRSIVESHGGRLLVSPAQPHGSIFRVSLPISCVDADG